MYGVCMDFVWSDSGLRFKFSVLIYELFNNDMIDNTSSLL